jgi:uncharacterized repeat protein (TIGR01451 family)
VTFTATLRNDGPQPVTALFANTLPPELDLISDTLSGGIHDSGTIRWEGALESGGEQTIRYSGIASAAITNTAVIHYAEHDLGFHRSVSIWTDAPDLTPSSLSAEQMAVVPGRPITYSLTIRNGGLEDAQQASSIWALPPSLSLLTTTVQASSGEARLINHQVQWSGTIKAGSTVALSLTAVTLPGLQRGWLSSTGVLNDGETDLLVRAHVIELRPLSFYLPLLMR